MALERPRDLSGIPLFVIPQELSRRIRQYHDRIYRISIKRTARHVYNIAIRTKALPRELDPVFAKRKTRGPARSPGSPGAAAGCSGGRP